MVVFNVLIHLAWVFVNKNRGVTGMHEYEIQEHGLLERTEFNQSLYSWAGFHKIFSTRGFFFVYVTDNNVHYFPWSAFPSVQQAQQFLAEIRSRSKIH
jgi:hypothetical protein